MAHIPATTVADGKPADDSSTSRRNESEDDGSSISSSSTVYPVATAATASATVLAGAISTVEVAKTAADRARRERAAEMEGV